MNKLLSEKDTAALLETTRSRLSRYRLAGKIIPTHSIGYGTNARYYYDGVVAKKMWEPYKNSHKAVDK